PNRGRRDSTPAAPRAWSSRSPGRGPRVVSRQSFLTLSWNAWNVSPHVAQQQGACKAATNRTRSEVKVANVLIPIPNRNFDPTEVAVSWSVLRRLGHSVVFATPDGRT